MPSIRTAPTAELLPQEIAALRGLFAAAWSDDPEQFSEDDWDHATGGTHFLVEDGGTIVSHASVVERELHADGHPLETGYVEAVATLPAQQGRGLGTAVMREVTAHIDRRFPLGALDTGLNGFYTRLGWVTWEGPTFVRTDAGLLRTAEDDGNVMVRMTASSPELDLSAPISCEWRPGDVW